LLVRRDAKGQIGEAASELARLHLGSARVSEFEVLSRRGNSHENCWILRAGPHRPAGLARRYGGAGADLLVRVKAVSVNPIDTKVRASAAPAQGEARVLGWDAAGVVEAVGDQATLFRPGDEVFYAGTLKRPGTNAELHAVDERIVGPKPRSLD
jgi:hypothetical protein